MSLRSLALMVLIFAASTALAGYVGMTYWKPAAQQHMQSAIQSSSPVPAPLAAGSARSSTGPETSVVSPVLARETLQSASENKMPHEILPSSKDTMELSRSNVPAPRTTGSEEALAPKCNKQACANAYRSFDAGDCTYQPANGPRRLCKKK
mgnify:FL=1